MSKKSLHHIPISEIKKAYNRSKTLTIIQAISITMLLIFGILTTLEKGINPFTFLPIAFLPMVVAGIIQMSRLKKEIRRRNE